MKDLLGGKGSGLAEMTNAGLPVPPGFTISTDVCTIYYKEKRKIPAAIDREIDEHVKKLEKAAGAKLGSTDNPLLVSVRSGAKFSMPGMMDTILNLGLNDQAVEGLEEPDAERPLRLRQLPPLHPDVRQRRARDSRRTRSSTSSRRSRRRASVEARHRPRRSALCATSSAATRRSCRKRPASAFPQDPREQLKMARDAVFRSWMNPRAKEYRRIYDIPDHIGTAVNVQMMVFGNTGRSLGHRRRLHAQPGDRRRRSSTANS